MALVEHPSGYDSGVYGLQLSQQREHGEEETGEGQQRACAGDRRHRYGIVLLLPRIIREWCCSKRERGRRGDASRPPRGSCCGESGSGHGNKKFRREKGRQDGDSAADNKQQLICSSRAHGKQRRSGSRFRPIPIEDTVRLA